MNARLSLANTGRKEQLAYAAAVLLDAMGLDLPLDVVALPEGSAPGLLLPGEVLVPEAKLAEVFASISLERELSADRYDQTGMFDEQAVAWDVSRPWIDLEAREIARKVALGAQVAPRKKRRFTVVVSHDIDRTTGLEPTSVLKWLMQKAGLYRNRGLPLSTAFHPRSMARNIQRLLDFETARGIGAYYFMLSGPYGLRRYSSRYSLHWRSARKIVDAIKRAGMTIGLHGSYYARDRGTYRQEKERLEEVVGGPVTCHRNHYLRFDPRRIWNQLAGAGIRYDFSVGFNHHLGFRAGSASVYRTFDLASGRQSDVLAVPLLYMDTLLFHADRGELFPRLSAALQEVKRVDGCVSLLFHPGWFLADDRFFPFFEDMIRLCEELGADLSGTLPDHPAAADGARPRPAHPDR